MCVLRSVASAHNERFVVVVVVKYCARLLKEKKIALVGHRSRERERQERRAKCKALSSVRVNLLFIEQAKYIYKLTHSLLFLSLVAQRLENQ